MKRKYSLIFALILCFIVFMINYFLIVNKGVDFYDPIFVSYWNKSSKNIEELDASIRKKCLSNYLSSYVFSAVKINNYTNIYIIGGTQKENINDESDEFIEVESFGVLMVKNKDKCFVKNFDAAIDEPDVLFNKTGISLSEELIFSLANDYKHRISVALRSNNKISLKELCSEFYEKGLDGGSIDSFVNKICEN